jgi:hypothetical protein
VQPGFNGGSDLNNLIDDNYTIDGVAQAPLTNVTSFNII